MDNERNRQKGGNDAANGRSYASINDSNNTGDGHGTGDQTTERDVDDDFLNSLPDPDDVEGCHYDVTVSGFKTVLTFNGRGCKQSGSVRTEVYAFDNLEAATEFCETISNNANCSTPPCGYCKSSCVVGPGSPECQTQGEGTQGLVGFRRDATNGPTGSFMSGEL